MRAVQIARELVVDAWEDAERLSHHHATEKIAGQLYAAVGSIGANLAEGYSRSSGRDRAKIFEYALGSARESMMWYRAAVPLLEKELVRSRLDKLEEIRRLLLSAIPRERGRLIRPSKR
jgi:four helix bundle protein